jgi:hypothetical protein
MTAQNRSGGLLDLAKQHVAAEDRRDVEAAVATMTENCIWTWDAFGIRLSGRVSRCGSSTRLPSSHSPIIRREMSAIMTAGRTCGASHYGQIFEIVQQLRGEAGARQIEGAKTGLAQVYGAWGHCGVSVLERLI